MDFIDIVRKNRSYRRFDASVPISEATLRELVGLARITPSGMNAQPLRYILSCEPSMNDRIFETLSWAGSLPDWPGPGPTERPTAYIVVLVDKATKATVGNDVGIACQTMLLGATERGLGGCMLGSVKRPAIAEILQIGDELDVALVVALGKPAETVVIEDAAAGEPTTYYRKPDGSHHVPKRILEDIIVGSYT